MFVPSSFSIVCPGVAHAHCLCHAVLQQDQAGTLRFGCFATAARGTTHPGAGDNASQSGCRFLSEKKKILPGKFPGINMFTVPMHIVRHDPDMSDLLLLCMIEGLCHLLSALFAQELPMRIARVMQSFNKIKQEPRAAGSSHGLQEEQPIQEQLIRLLSLGADSCLKRKRFCLESSLGSTCLLFPCTLWGTTQTCLTSFYCAWLRVCAIFFQHCLPRSCPCTLLVSCSPWIRSSRNIAVWMLRNGCKMNNSSRSSWQGFSVWALILVWKETRSCLESSLGWNCLL